MIPGYGNILPRLPLPPQELGNRLPQVTLGSPDLVENNLDRRFCCTYQFTQRLKVPVEVEVKDNELGLSVQTSEELAQVPSTRDTAIPMAVTSIPSVLSTSSAAWDNLFNFSLLISK